ncbi:MAG: hypothetical protein ACTHU0_21560 [Kofleriaceae bacterium]
MTAAPAWPPMGDGTAALPAFSAAVCPVLTSCWCGSDVGYGQETTRLQMELRVCSRCPPEGTLRQAMLEGLERDAADLAACERDEEHSTYWPPYSIGSTERRVSAGTASEDERALVDFCARRSCRGGAR